MSDDKKIMETMISKFEKRRGIVLAALANKNLPGVMESMLREELNVLHDDIKSMYIEKEKYFAKNQWRSEVLKVMKGIEYPVLWMKNIMYILDKLSAFDPGDQFAGSSKIDLLISGYNNQRAVFTPSQIQRIETACNSLLKIGGNETDPFRPHIFSNLLTSPIDPGEVTILKSGSLGASTGQYSIPIIRSFISVLSEEYIHARSQKDIRKMSDDEYKSDELCLAAASYILPFRMTVKGVPCMWPWPHNSWKPSPDDRKKEIVKAAHLLWSEYERLSRSEIPPVKRCKICERTATDSSFFEISSEPFLWIDYDLCSFCNEISDII